ncbi:NAD(P)H-dependent oxidoreductase [Streptomyces sp. NPDC047841]|uniref:NADPH-dependent FMN reductase n=1 Tax=Streptomyces sp. NPDC047841 TaxID=3154708 RepID=UPI0034563A08
MNTPTPRRLLILSGAASHGSRTHAVAEAVSRHVVATGGRPVLRDLSEHELPLLHTAPQASDALADLRHQAAEADALVWVTPCYHGSYSGLLKNALDHLREPDLRGKPVGLVAVGTSLTAVQACDHLRSVARALGCVAVPTHAVITGMAASADTGSEQDTAARLSRMISEIHVLAESTWRLRHDPALLASSGAGS